MAWCAFGEQEGPGTSAEQEKAISEDHDSESDEDDDYDPDNSACDFCGWEHGAEIDYCEICGSCNHLIDHHCGILGICIHEVRPSTVERPLREFWSVYQLYNTFSALMTALDHSKL